MSFDSTQPHVTTVLGDPATYWVVRGAEILSGPYPKRDLAVDALAYHRAHPDHVGTPPVMGGQGRDTDSILSSAQVIVRIVVICAALLALSYLLS